MNVKIYNTGSTYASQQNLGTPGNRFKEVTNFVAQSERCKAERVEISTMVYSSGPGKRYETTFYLNPNNCMIPEDVNFDKDCSRTEGSRPTSTTPNQANSTEDGPHEGDVNPEGTPMSNLVIGGISAGTLVIIIVIIVVIFLICKKTKEKKSKQEHFRTDENHVYGTYSRGSVEDGEYGDGDVVEFTDNNENYGQ